MINVKEDSKMKLIFTSFGFNSPVVREEVEKLMPCGDELAEAVCFVLPYAGFNTERTFEREKEGLCAFGFRSENIFLAASEADFSKVYPNYIYVPGGDPFKLLASLRERGLLSLVRDCVINKKAVYIGVSAGAYIAAEKIDYVRCLEDNNVISNGDFEALGLISESIICHYDHYGFSEFTACEEAGGREVITLNDDGVALFENGEYTFL